MSDANLTGFASCQDHEHLQGVPRVAAHVEQDRAHGPSFWLPATHERGARRGFLMRKMGFYLALITLVTTACGVIRLGGDPSAVRLDGSWTGALEVEGQEVVGVLTLSQRGRDLRVRFSSTGLIGQATGSGRIEDGGRVRLELKYNVQCSGAMVLSGAILDQDTRIRGSVIATDCTGDAEGAFVFARL